jgi:hypothetical protein
MDRQKGYWLGTFLAIAGVVVGILAWQLPKDPPKPTPSPLPTETVSVSPTETVSVSPTVNANANATLTVAPHDVPTQLIGAWQGYATGAGGTFAVALNLQQGGEGEYVGAFLIPVAGCRSDVILTSGQSAGIEVRILVKTGACVSGNARFSLQANGLGYQALTTDGQSVTGFLQRA